MCDFPARELLAYRRSIAADANRPKNEPKVRAIASAIMFIDRLRMAHEDIDDCQCWHEAVGQEALVGASR